jgi:flagellar FliL protein
MASQATTAPEELDEEEGAAAQAAPASGLRRFTGIFGRLRGMSRKQMIIFGGAALLVAGLGYGGLKFFGGGAESSAPAVFYYDLPEMVVNLASTHERPQFLRLRVTLEIDDEAVIQSLQPVLPRVIDTFQVHLRELRAIDLDGSVGMYRLREELNRRINHAIAPAQVRAVLFREIVVQ